MVWRTGSSCRDQIWECVLCTSLMQRRVCVRNRYLEQGQEEGKEEREGVGRKSKISWAHEKKN